MEERTALDWLFDDKVDFNEEIPLKPVGPAVNICSNVSGSVCTLYTIAEGIKVM